MTLPSCRRVAGAARSLAALLIGAATVAAPIAASAQGLFAQPKYAANRGGREHRRGALYSMRAEALRHPASLTKIMTLYLTFEALSTGRAAHGRGDHHLAARLLDDAVQGLHPIPARR